MQSLEDVMNNANENIAATTSVAEQTFGSRLNVALDGLIVDYTDNSEPNLDWQILDDGQMEALTLNIETEIEECEQTADTEPKTSYL